MAKDKTPPADGIQTPPADGTQTPPADGTQTPPAEETQNPPAEKAYRPTKEDIEKGYAELRKADIKGKITVNTHGTLFSKTDGYTGGDIVEAGTEVDIIVCAAEIGYTPVNLNGKTQWIDNDCIEIIEAE